MTNEEKANALAKDYLLGHDRANITYEEMLGACLDMAEWKDKQYSEIIKEECNTSYESGLAEGEKKVEARFKEYLKKKFEWAKGNRDACDFNHPERHDFIVQVEAYREIINELFKKY